jgi:alpha-glucoside transport system permease protein
VVTWSSLFDSSWPKILQTLTVLAIFFGFYGIAFAAGARVRGKKQNWLAIALFLVPALILVIAGLGVPAFQTLLESFKSADSSKWVGFRNYTLAFNDPEIRLSFINTLAWVAICPIIVTSLGLSLATMLNKMKREAIAEVFNLHANGDLLRGWIAYLELDVLIPRAESPTDWSRRSALHLAPPPC